MKYDQIEKDCQKIKELYNPDDIEVRTDYYRCTIKTPVGDFDFLVSPERIGKPFGLKLSEEYDSNITYKAIKKMRALKCLK